MPSKMTMLIAATFVVVAVAGMFAVDQARSDVVANGVLVGTVDVSGLSRADARERLHQRLLKPLDDPLVVSAADETFPLSAREARIHADVDAMVDEAVRRGREGGVLDRTWRAISGKRRDIRVAPRIAYSRAAVQRLVDKVRVAVSRKPVDAKVDFASSALTIRAAKSGRTIDTKALRRQVEAALVSPAGTRSITAPLRKVKPKVTGEKLASKYPVVLTVNRGGYQITLFKRLKKVKTYRIAVGQAGLETPAGLYKIQNKAINPAWHVPNSAWAGSLAGSVIPGGAPNNPLKARWLGVYDGVGVHGTDARGSIGTNASHGCIRMLVEDVEALYDEVPVGTPIYID